MLRAAEIAIKRIKKSKTSFAIIFLTCTLTLTCSLLLLKIKFIENLKYDQLNQNFDAVIGPKLGGVEILLGSLRFEEAHQDYIPYQLFESLKKGVDIRFEDGTVVSTSNLIDHIIPVLFLGRLNQNPIIACDESLNSHLKFRESGQIYVGSDVNLDSNNQQQLILEFKKLTKIIAYPIRNIQILEKTNTIWDKVIYLSLQDTQELMRAKQISHPVWRSQILNAIYIKMSPEKYVGLNKLIQDRTVAQSIWVSDEIDHLKAIVSATDQVEMMIGGIFLILVITALTGLLTLQFNEIKTSLAVLRVIGFTNQYISAWIFFEFFFVVTLAYIFSVIIEWILYQTIISQIEFLRDIELSVQNDFELYFSLLVMTIVVSFIAYRFTLYRLKNINLPEELKS